MLESFYSKFDFWYFTNQKDIKRAARRAAIYVDDTLQVFVRDKELFEEPGTKAHKAQQEKCLKKFQGKVIDNLVQPCTRGWLFCPYCSLVFSGSHAFSNHMRTH